MQYGFKNTIAWKKLMFLEEKSQEKNIEDCPSKLPSMISNVIIFWFIFFGL